MDFGELVTSASLDQEMSTKCPFSEAGQANLKKSAESIADDDLDSVQELQKNDGGVLGENLSAGNNGVADGGPFPPDDFRFAQPPIDTYRGRMSRVYVDGYRDAKGGDFPFSVAAHHVIPGNASLYRSSLKAFLGPGSVTSLNNREYKIVGEIGYDVNGSHNGVWLPGNYAIKTARPERRSRDGKRTLPAREGTSPIDGVSWAELGPELEEWQFDYVASACKAGRGQFHDSHERPYSASVRAYLNKITVSLSHHLDSCEVCSKPATTEIPPPFRVKRRLYALSKRLRQYVMGHPTSWKTPWFTSQKWLPRYFNRGKISKDFLLRYSRARETKPHTI